MAHRNNPMIGVKDMETNVIGFFKRTGDVQIVNLPPKSMKMVIPEGANPDDFDGPTAFHKETILDIRNATEEDVNELKHHLECANLPTRLPPKKQRNWLVR